MKRKAHNILVAGKTSEEKKVSDEGNRDREETNNESQDEGQHKVNNEYRTPLKTYANAVMADQPKNHRSQKHSYSKVTSEVSVKLEKLSYPGVLKGEYHHHNCECMLLYVCGSK